MQEKLTVLHTKNTFASAQSEHRISFSAYLLSVVFNLAQHKISKPKKYPTICTLPLKKDPKMNRNDP